MGSEESAKIRDAASLLIKGGTLTGEPCEKCGSIMIKFGDKTTCISCGAEKSAAPVPKQHARDSPTQSPPPPSDLRSCIEVVEQKIVRLTAEIESENDITVQKQKADLLETYLRILERVKSMSL
jgi:uncharacterized Zn finger protein (UPF0148 family)